MGVVDRLLGTPGSLRGSALARALRHGSEPYVVRCVRALAERSLEDGLSHLLPLLNRAEPSVRRAAARALGHLEAPAALPSLQLRGATERSEECLLALAEARIRCGEPAEAVLVALDLAEQRTLITPDGPRSPTAVTDAAPWRARVWDALGDPGGPIQDRAALAAARRRDLREATGRAQGDAALHLATLAHSDDLEPILACFRSAGRRGEHTLLLALGLTGDPRSAAPLRAALRATDVDPGRGFAQRRIAATGLGRLGLRVATPWLLRALQDEAHDYEGRPGAGLGIQYPVRTNLLWALGEIGDPTSIPTLVTYLGDTHGSALGGFYLPAMDALMKLGAAAVPALTTVAARGADLAAAHAVSVLLAAGEDVGRWLRDPRPAVAAVARQAGVLPPSPPRPSPGSPR